MKIFYTYYFIFSFLLFGHTYGQQTNKGLNIGIQVGLTYAGIRSVHPDNALSDIDNTSIASYNANAYIKYQFSRRLSISIEPGLVVKGADIERSAFLNYTAGTVEYRFQYITMPLMMNYSFLHALSIGAGIETGYLSKSEYKSPETNGDFSRFTEEIDFGVIAGIDFGPVRFIDIAFRYSYGVIPVMKTKVVDNTGTEAGDRKDYNKMAQLVLRFNIIKPK